MTLLQLYNDDLFQDLLLKRTDAWLDTTFWITCRCWGTVVLASSNGTLGLHVLLVCVWVVLFFSPSYTCINYNTQTNIQTKYLHYLAKHLSKKYSKFKCKYVQHLWTKPKQTYIQNTYTILQKHMSEMKFKLKCKHQSYIPCYSRLTLDCWCVFLTSVILWMHTFSCLQGARYWIFCIYEISDLQGMKFRPTIVDWFLFPTP